MPKKNSVFRIELILLGVLNKKDCYGYELTTTIRDISNGLFDIKEGVMYPILYKLLNEGYLSTYENVVSHKVRVYYHLEEKGQKYYNSLVSDYRKMSACVEKIIG